MNEQTDFNQNTARKILAKRNSTQVTKNFLNFASLPVLLLTVVLTLAGLGVPALALRRGDRSQEVVELQKALQSKGYYTGEITGYYGSETRAAVRKYQRDNSLKVDGIAGRRTLAALQANLNPTKNSPSDKSLDSSQLGKDSDKNKIASAQKPQDATQEIPKSKLEDDRPVTNLEPKESASEPTAPAAGMKLIKTIAGGISPKSIVYSGKGLFFAQNMMYSHTITVYDRNFKLVKTIPDRIHLSDYGFSKFKGDYQGSPVEASFSPDGKYAYISNYQMYGTGFKNPGSDRCSPSGKHDESFLYRINTQNLKIDQVISVGAVPKFTAVSPNSRLVLVSNWCTWDLSIIDAQKNKEIERVKLGAYPRGIVVDSASKYAYIAVMGSANIAKVNLKDFSVEWLKNIGSSPRHLNIDPAGKYLYATLNGEGTVAKIDLKAGKAIDKVGTGRAPRSMTISQDGQFLYVVNYFSNTVSKVRTSDLKVLQQVRVNSSPIGITYDPKTRQVWVACYSGSILVFQD